MMNIASPPQEIVRVGVGERRYEVRQLLPMHWIIAVVFYPLGVIGLVTGADPRVVAGWLIVGTLVFLGTRWAIKFQNYVIVHPKWIDLREHGEEGRYHVPYAEIVDVMVNDDHGWLNIRYRRASQLIRKLGFDEIEVSLRLKDPAALPDIREAIELGRELAAETKQAAPSA